jgi:FkbM family methyltransferase
MARDFDAYFNGVVPQQEGSNLVVDFSKSCLQTFQVSKLEFEITGFPEEEETIQDYFRWYTPQAGEVLFDIGGNCGVSAYHLSQAAGPTGKVYVFEPDPANYEVLLRNIKRHRLSNVVAVQKAISPTAGELKFFSEGTNGSTLALFSTRPTTGKIITVEAITLAGACETYGVPSFIKMDIEGAEVEVIASAGELLRKHSIQFAVDTHHWRDGALTTARVEKSFQDFGFETLSSDESGFTTTWARRKPAAG